MDNADIVNSMIIAGMILITVVIISINSSYRELREMLDNLENKVWLYKNELYWQIEKKISKEYSCLQTKIDDLSLKLDELSEKEDK